MEFNTQMLAGIAIFLVALWPVVPKSLAWVKAKLATVKDDAPVEDASAPTRNTVVSRLLPIGDDIASLGIPSADTAYQSLVVELMKGQSKA